MRGLSGRYKNPFRVEAKIIPNGVMTDEATKDVFISSIDVCNDTAGALTLTIQDKQGTVVEFFKDVSIGAKTTVSVNFNELRKFKGGISWQASGVGLNGQMEGYQAPTFAGGLGAG